MNSIQLEKKLLAYTKGLPKETLQEIIDFIQFLRQKKAKEPMNNITIELSSLDHSQRNHLEEEFKDYKQLYPSE